MSEELTYSEFMRGMMNAPWDDDKCGECGGIGLKPVHCCNGFECGCRGMPVDFVECACGSKQPTDEQISGFSPLNRTLNNEAQRNKALSR